MEWSYAKDNKLEIAQIDNGNGCGRADRRAVGKASRGRGQGQRQRPEPRREVRPTPPRAPTRPCWSPTRSSAARAWTPRRPRWSRTSWATSPRGDRAGLARGAGLRPAARRAADQGAGRGQAICLTIARNHVGRSKTLTRSACDEGPAAPINRHDRWKGGVMSQTETRSRRTPSTRTRDAPRRSTTPGGRPGRLPGGGSPRARAPPRCRPSPATPPRRPPRSGAGDRGQAGQDQPGRRPGLPRPGRRLGCPHRPAGGLRRRVPALAWPYPACWQNPANFLTSRNWIVAGDELSFGIAGLLWTTVLTAVDGHGDRGPGGRRRRAVPHPIRAQAGLRAAVLRGRPAGRRAVDHLRPLGPDRARPLLLRSATG